MKKHILLALLILITSCTKKEYSKRWDILENHYTGEPEYTLWIQQKHGGLYNRVGRLPITQVTQNKIDSMENIADSFILKLKEIDEYRQKRNN